MEKQILGTRQTKKQKETISDNSSHASKGRADERELRDQMQAHAAASVNRRRFGMSCQRLRAVQLHEPSEGLGIKANPLKTDHAELDARAARMRSCAQAPSNSYIVAEATRSRSMPHRHSSASLWTRGQPDQGRCDEQDRRCRPEDMDNRQCRGLRLDHVVEHLKHRLGRETQPGD